MERDEFFKYFMDQTNQRFDKVESKLDQLISFRLMLLGGAAAVSSIVSTLIVIYFGK